MNSKQIGNKTEEIVTQYIISKGYTIEKRNFRCLYGEIDIIASKDDSVFVIEVKKIPGSWDISDLKYKITNSKINNIKKTFSVYLAQNHVNKYNNIRFDVAIVTDGDVKYFEGAF